MCKNKLSEIFFKKETHLQKLQQQQHKNSLEFHQRGDLHNAKYSQEICKILTNEIKEEARWWCNTPLIPALG